MRSSSSPPSLARRGHPSSDRPPDLHPKISLVRDAQRHEPAPFRDDCRRRASVRHSGVASVELAPWSVMTWNIHGSAKPSIDALAAAIAVEAPDIVVVQEIRKKQAATLAGAISMRYTWALKHHPYTQFVWWRSEGMAILTRHVLDARGSHRDLQTVSRSGTGGGGSPCGRSSAAPIGSAVRIYNLHLSPHENAPSRRAEAVRVREIVAEHGDEPVRRSSPVTSTTPRTRRSSMRCPVSSI